MRACSFPLDYFQKNCRWLADFQKIMGNDRCADKVPFRCGCANDGLQEIALNERAKNGGFRL